MFQRAEPLTRRDYLALVIILLVAAFVRLTDLDVSEFAYDQATLSTRAQTILQSGNIPLLGTDSSVGTHNTPIAVYLLTIPYAIATSPLAAIAFTALLNVIAVGLLWGIVRRYFGFTPALIAGLLYACSLWAIFYSRKIWEPNFVPFFFLTALFCALIGFGEGKRWAQIICLPALMLAFQLHFSTLLLFPIFVWIVWMGRRNISIASFFFGGLLAALTITPYIIGISQAGGAGVNSTTLFPHVPPSAAWTSLLYAITGWGQETVTDPHPLQHLYAALTLPQVLLGGILVLIVLGIIQLWRTRRAFAVLGVGWLLLPALFMTSGQVTPYLHYSLPVIPAACLLAGIGFSVLIRPRIVAILASIVTALLLLTQIITWREFIHTAATTYNIEQGFFNPEDGLAAPLKAYLPMREALSSSHDVVIMGGSPGVGDYLVLAPLFYGEADCVRELATVEGGLMLFPAHPFTVIQSFRSPLNKPYTNANLRTFPLRSGEGSYQVFDFDTAPQADLPTLTSLPPVTFDNGVMVDAYARVDQQMYIQWKLPSRQYTSYQYTIQFLDTQGQRLDGRDTSFYPGPYWCAGDRLVTWIDVHAPPDTTSIRIGMYQLTSKGQIIPVQAHDDTGSSVSGSMVTLS